MAKSNTGKRIASRIPSIVKARIVQLALQHPDFGPKRLLPLLNKENINVSASSIYNVLKHHGLQNREKRYARLQAHPWREALDHPKADRRPRLGTFGIVPGGLRLNMPSREKNRHPLPQTGASRIPVCISRPVLEGPAEYKVRTPLALTVVVLLLLAIVAFAVPHAVLKNRRTGLTMLSAAEVRPAAIRVGEDAVKMPAITLPAMDGAIRKRALPESRSPTEPPSDVQPPFESVARPYLSGAGQNGDGFYSPWSFNLRFEELEAWLGDTRRLWHEAAIYPYTKNDLPAGFTVAHLTPDTLLNKMGLQNGDVIQGVNGEAISSPEQAPYFFQVLAQGGVVEIKIKRHRRTRYISLTIQ